MNLRKEIPLRNRLEDDDSYVDPVPRGRTTKPKVWRAPKREPIPFKLQPAAFPSLPLKLSLNPSSNVAQDIHAPAAESELPAHPIDIIKIETVDQSRYASKIDFHNSNNLSQGFPLAARQTVAWSNLGLATQLIIWTQFRKSTQSRVAAELLGLTVEQQKCIESLQCVSAISDLTETGLHEQIRKEYQREIPQYNFPYTHSQIAAKFIDDLILEGHLYHPYEYEIERGKKFLHGLGLTKISLEWEPFTPERTKGQKASRKPVQPIKLVHSNSSDSGYDSALPSKECRASNPAMLSPRRKRSAGEAFSGPVLVQNSSFNQDAPAHLVPPTAVAQAIRSTTHALSQYIAQPEFSKMPLEHPERHPEPPVTFTQPVNRKSPDPLLETRSIQSGNISSAVASGIEKFLATSTKHTTIDQPRRNESRDARWSSQAWRDLKNTEGTYRWRRGGYAEEEQLAYSSESELPEFDPNNIVEPSNRQQNPTTPVSVGLSEEGNNITKRSVIMKIKNGVAVLRKEKIFKTDGNSLPSPDSDGIGAKEAFEHAPNPTKNGLFNLEILSTFANHHIEDKLQITLRQGQESPLPIENLLPIEFRVSDALRDIGLPITSYTFSEDRADNGIKGSGQFPTTESQTKEVPPKHSSNSPVITTRDISAELNRLPGEEEPQSGEITPVMMLVHQLKKTLDNKPQDVSRVTATEIESVHTLTSDESVSSSSSSLSKRQSLFGAEDLFLTGPIEGLSDMGSLVQKEQPSSPRKPPFSPITPPNARSPRRSLEFTDVVMSEAGPVDPFHGDSNWIQPASDLAVQDLPLGEPVASVVQAELNVEKSPVPKPLRLKLLMGRRSLGRESCQLSLDDQSYLTNGVPKVPSNSLVDNSSAEISDPLLPTAPQSPGLTPTTIQRKKKANETKETEKTAPLKKSAKHSTSALNTSDENAHSAKSEPARQALLAQFGGHVSPSIPAMAQLDAGAAQSPVSIAKKETTQILDQAFQTAKDRIDNAVQGLDSGAESMSAASNTATPTKGGSGTRTKVKSENSGKVQKTQLKDAGRKRGPYKTKKMREEERLKRESEGLRGADGGGMGGEGQAEMVDGGAAASASA